MDDLSTLVSAKPGLPTNVSAPVDPMVDELEIARRRMRHLAPWHVAPMPMRSVTRAASPAKLETVGEDRCRDLALRVLAVQMALAKTTSALS